MKKQKLMQGVTIILLILTGVVFALQYRNDKEKIEILNGEIETQKSRIVLLSDEKSYLESQLENSNTNLKNFEHDKYATELNDYEDYITDSLIRSIEKFELDSFDLSIRKITKYEFNKLITDNNSNKFEGILHMNWKAKPNENVKRINNSTFVYKIDSERMDTLKNKDIGKMSFSTYKYAGFIEEINSYLFAVQYYEAHDCILISKNTGEKINLNHHIVSSAKHQILVTYDWDEWTYTSGGITFYDIIDKKLKIRFEFDPPGTNSYISTGFYWSFSDIYITNRNSITFKCQFQDYRTSKTYWCYAVFEIKEKVNLPTN
ncbi:hypothetical protein [Carboxylicivirga caseinilyticus]|uniref:hypothetical protein n=1 Tax=Carboxylicivirga caseinilyticus TaxID=3417572 RepID=UPI003D32DA6B|nr:hypothetical protein [Marinilabiliaceae bacterium A049]